jgi:hypothetical protein
MSEEDYANLVAALVAVVRRVEWLVNIPHEVNDKFEGL